jgi:hypothetical protein
MSDQPKKPKDIKDLKARLGRTIAPTTSKAADIAPPVVGVPVAGVVPPPAAAGPAPAIPAPPVAAPASAAPASVPAPAPGVVPPPAVVPAPVVPPPVAAPFGGNAVPSPFGGAAVAPPPFAQPAAPSAPPRPADPFAVVQQASPQEVRLVIDEKPVDESEVGRRQRGRTLIVLGLGLLLGAALGFGVGNVVDRNAQFKAAVMDGKEIYDAVRGASDTVNSAKRIVTAALEKAGGQNPEVDFAGLEQLRALKKPFEAGVFSRRKYGAFQPATVDALFEYFNNTNLVWDQIARLTNRSLSQSGRTELTNAVAAAGTMASTQYGLIPRSIEGAIVGSLVFVDPAARNAQGPRTKVPVRASRGGQAVEKTIYAGQSLESNPEQYVILIDGASSVAVLGQQAGAFAEYRRALLDLKQLLDKTTELQGRLENELGQIAALAN